MTAPLRPTPLSLSIDVVNCIQLRAHAERRVMHLLAKRLAATTPERAQALREEIELFRDFIAAIDYARMERGLII